ncbi:MAG: 4Fe-4S binding protein [Planctomycetes bacterium]|nr:4Fe-4S binding protein [Planctomycetota bacterium]
MVVDENYCKGCGVCVYICARNVLALSKEVNRRGFYQPLVVDEAKCTGCRQCELFCPDLAIFLVEEAACGKG